MPTDAGRLGCAEGVNDGKLVDAVGDELGKGAVAVGALEGFVVGDKLGGCERLAVVFVKVRVGVLDCREG